MKTNDTKIRLAKYVIPMGIISILFFSLSIIIFKLINDQDFAQNLQIQLVNAFGFLAIIALLISALLILIGSISIFVRSFLICRNMKGWRITSIILSVIILIVGSVAITLLGLYLNEIIKRATPIKFDVYWFEKMRYLFEEYMVGSKRIFYITTFGLMMGWFFLSIIYISCGRILAKHKLCSFDLNHNNFINEVNSNQKSEDQPIQQEVKKEEMINIVEIKEEEISTPSSSVIKEDSDDDWLMAPQDQASVTPSPLEEKPKYDPNDVNSIFD